jgi:hypothetical protein
VNKNKDNDTILRLFAVLPKCNFGSGVLDQAKQRFLQSLIPCEKHLAACQMDIGNVGDPKKLYKLRLNNTISIRAKPIKLRPKEEVLLDVHLDELLAKGVICLILPHE